MPIITFDQKDRPYIRRIIKSLFSGYLIYILFLIFIGGIFTEGFFWSIIVCLGVFAYLSLSFSLKCRYYIKKIEFDSDKGLVSLIILKFDKVYINKSFLLKEIDFECFERRLMYNSFYLIIRNTNHLLIKQPSVGGWRKKMFEDIVMEYKRIKSEFK